jgi:hypothetical protein
MQPNMMQGKWRQVPRRQRPHWGILTLDDLDKRNWKHSQLIIQLRARFKAEKKQGKDRPDQKAEDISE